MSVHWMYDLPLWLLCLLLVGVSVFVGVSGVFVVRKRDWMVTPEDSGTAGLAHAFIGVMYAVALGLIVVGVQGSYGDVEHAVVAEASAASDLYRTMEGLNPADRDRLQGIVERYADAVVTQEWPAIRRAESSEATWRLMDSVAREIFTYPPEGEHERLLYPQMVSDVSVLLDARRTRLFLGGSGVGPVTWMVVIIGALITLGFAWFFPTGSQRAHAVMLGVMSAMFGLMIFLIVAMDHPLWGDMSVEPDAFEQVQVNLDRWKAERSDVAVPAP